MDGKIIKTKAMLKIKSKESSELLQSINLLLKENDLQIIQDSLNKMFEAYIATTADNPREKQTVKEKYSVLQQHLVVLDMLADRV